MPATHDDPADLLRRMRDTAGLAPLVAEAVATWRARASASGHDATEQDAAPGWRAFTDSFPTFWEFTNRPR